jgi:CBS domain-containing protein
MTIQRTTPDPTALDRVTGTTTVTTATCIHEALALLRRSGEHAAVVYGNGRPVGVVTAAALARARGGRRPDMPLAAVMDYVAVPVETHADAQTTLHRFNQAAWDWLKHTRA